ncbi:hypothetical protein FHS16_002531 [Paenibacillus endophyticus]|uniref:Uncharacterized protein n=1 Tax=Paenibacillus endophyticus TaxID=1294268 RepID=A0A7W5C7G2_9BACL|nr:hypothetical protein [Paenibacillus endophyticus]MBB3152481.1 hypothetical protein [Paenibacillus endophyticus]
MHVKSPSAIWRRAYRESGLTLQAWCEQAGITKEQMKYWMYKRKKVQSSDSSSVSRVGYVPVYGGYCSTDG